MTAGLAVGHSDRSGSLLNLTLEALEARISVLESHVTILAEIYIKSSRQSDCRNGHQINLPKTFGHEIS